MDIVGDSGDRDRGDYILDKEDWLVERLKTSRTLCDIALFLRANDKDEWLPTILELLLYYAQVIVDDSCVVK